MENQLEQVSVSDVDRLQHLAARTFRESFAQYNLTEDVETYIKTSLTRDRLLTELNNTASTFYWFLVKDQPVAYLKLNEEAAQTESGHPDTLEIERIYVLANFQNKKLGQLLFDKAISIAQQKQYHYLWLGVWEDNHRAISFYQNNGLTAFGKHHFVLGSSSQTDILMKLSLPSI